MVGSGRGVYETMGGETGARIVLLLGLEISVLYIAGSYAMGRLMAISGFGGGMAPGRIAFFLLVFPGVVLHEGSHYLACLLTGTKVSRFAAFSPRRSADGRLVLGYVRHERRAFPIGTVIGLAPILLNPLGILLFTALLTPLTLSEVVDPSLETFENGLAGGFLTQTPLLAAVWAYLSLSLALGSVPSREDLSGMPAVLLLLGGSVFLLGLFRAGSDSGFSSALLDVAALAAGLYALPAAVALVAALIARILR
ncbi:MAG: hypothetical protein ACRDTR_17340 [Rubrobacter sp.]